MRAPWIRWLLSLVAVAAAWGGIVSIAHRARLESLRRSDVPDILAPQPHLPESVLRQIGFFSSKKDSSFVRFAKEKPDGVTRVCAFGDSFTHGDEVGNSNDYPTLLQRRFDADQPGRYEVLNFGQGWFGFHQAFILYDEVGGDFGCDILLLGPSGFYADRDTSFNHARERNPYYLHARYVLDGDGVRRIDVIGETAEDRFEEYHRLVPHARYLRYDDAAPAALLALLPAGFTSDNPFYYADGSKEDEARQTWRILLRDLAARGPRIILAGRLETKSIADEIPGIATFRPVWPRSFPYRAPRNHFGPLGNDLIAQQFERAVRGESQRPLPGVRTMARDESRGPFQAEAPPPLSSFDKIHARLGLRRLGRFVRGRTHLDRSGTAGRLHTDGVAALVLAATPGPMLHTGSDGPLDGCFLELSQAVADGTPVVLESPDGSETIGHVRLWHPDLAIGEIVLADRSRRHPELLSDDHGGRFALPPSIAETDERKGEPTKIRIADEVLLQGDPDDLRSTREACWVLRANARGWLDVNDLPASGDVHLVALRDGEEPLRVPISRWEKTAIQPFR